MKRFLPLFFLPISSCAISEPLAKEKASNNRTYEVDYLFEHKGCKVYRFQDLGRWIYFTNCQGETISKKDSSRTVTMLNHLPSASTEQPVDHQK